MTTITITKINGDVLSVPYVDIRKKSTTKSQLGVSASKLIASDFTLILDNTGPVYEPRSDDGFFSGLNWYNADITVYDDDVKQNFFHGRIKEVSLQDSDRSLTVYAVNIVREIADAVCVISDTTGTLTPAAAVYAILTDEAGLNIPAKYINSFEFQSAIAYQAANSVYVVLDIARDKNVKCIDVINELGTMSLCSMKLEGDIIGIVQDTPYSGENGMLIENKHVIQGSYEQSVSDDDIHNSYTIKYWNGSAYLSASDYDSLSRATYGDRSLIIPSKSVTYSDTPVVADMRIALYGLAAATFCGAQTIYRDKFPRQSCSFAVSNDIADNIQVGEILPLAFDLWVNEPVKVTAYEPQTNGSVKIDAYFVNWPERVTRSKTRPQPPVICAIMTGLRTIYLTIQPVYGCVGYRLRLRHSSGETVERDVKAAYANHPVELRTFASQGQYSISIQSYTSDLIISEESPSVSVTVGDSGSDPVFYKCFGRGQISVNSNYFDSLPSDLPLIWHYSANSKWNSRKYSPGAVYITPSIQSSHVIFHVEGDIDIYYRTYVLGWGKWIKFGRLSEGMHSIRHTGNAVQIAAIFHIVTRNDTVKFAILEAL